MLVQRRGGHRARPPGVKCQGCGTDTSKNSRYTSEGKDGTDQVEKLYCNSCYIRWQRYGALCPQCGNVHTPSATGHFPEQHAECLKCHSEIGDWRAELTRREAVIGYRYLKGGRSFEDFPTPTQDIIDVVRDPAKRYPRRQPCNNLDSGEHAHVLDMAHHGSAERPWTTTAASASNANASVAALDGYRRRLLAKEPATSTSDQNVRKFIQLTHATTYVPGRMFSSTSAVARFLVQEQRLPNAYHASFHHDVKTMLKEGVSSRCGEWTASRIDCTHKEATRINTLIKAGVGTQVSIKWGATEKWYTATITDYDLTTRRHQVDYVAENYCEWVVLADVVHEPLTEKRSKKKKERGDSNAAGKDSLTEKHPPSHAATQKQPKHPQGSDPMHRSAAVEQYDLETGKTLKLWPSDRTAETTLQIGNVRRAVVSDTRTAGGYGFRTVGSKKDINGRRNRPTKRSLSYETVMVSPAPEAALESAAGDSIEIGAWAAEGSAVDGDQSSISRSTAAKDASVTLHFAPNIFPSKGPGGAKQAMASTAGSQKNAQAAMLSAAVGTGGVDAGDDAGDAGGAARRMRRKLANSNGAAVAELVRPLTTTAPIYQDATSLSRCECGKDLSLENGLGGHHSKCQECLKSKNGSNVVKLARPIKSKSAALPDAAAGGGGGGGGTDAAGGGGGGTDTAGCVDVTHSDGGHHRRCLDWKKERGTSENATAAEAASSHRNSIDIEGLIFVESQMHAGAESADVDGEDDGDGISSDGLRKEASNIVEGEVIIEELVEIEGEVQPRTTNPRYKHAKKYATDNAVAYRFAIQEEAGPTYADVDRGFKKVGTQRKATGSAYQRNRTRTDQPQSESHNASSITFSGTISGVTTEPVVGKHAAASASLASRRTSKPADDATQRNVDVDQDSQLRNARGAQQQAAASKGAHDCVLDREFGWRPGECVQVHGLHRSPELNHALFVVQTRDSSNPETMVMDRVPVLQLGLAEMRSDRHNAQDLAGGKRDNRSSSSSSSSSSGAVSMKVQMVRPANLRRVGTIGAPIAIGARVNAFWRGKQYPATILDREFAYDVEYDDGTVEYTKPVATVELIASTDTNDSNPGKIAKRKIPRLVDLHVALKKAKVASAELEASCIKQLADCKVRFEEKAASIEDAFNAKLSERQEWFKDYIAKNALYKEKACAATKKAAAAEKLARHHKEETVTMQILGRKQKSAIERLKELAVQAGVDASLVNAASEVK